MAIRLIAFMLLLSGSISNAIAQDNLAPDIPYITGIDDYSIKLKTVFSEGLEKEVLLRALVLPTFSSEYMTGIRKKGANHEAFMIEARYDNGKIQSSSLFKKEISEQFSIALMEIWKGVLLDVKHSEKPRLIIDGTTFHLSMFLQGHGEIGGVVSSPIKDSKMGELSKLITSLAKYSRNELDEVVFKEQLKSFQLADSLIISDDIKSSYFLDETITFSVTNTTNKELLFYCSLEAHLDGRWQENVTTIQSTEVTKTVRFNKLNSNQHYLLEWSPTMHNRYLMSDTGMYRFTVKVLQELGERPFIGAYSSPFQILESN